MHDAIVIGGGIVGSSVAYHLARDGADVLLADREREGRATAAGAGILSPATSSHTGSDPWFRFAVEAVGYYPDLVERLEDEQDGETGYARPGMLSVAVSPDEVEPFERAKRRIDERAEALGHPDPGAVYGLSAEEARERFPPLASPRRALYYENAGRVDGRVFTGALRRAADGYGLTTADAWVERLVFDDGAVAGVVADGTDYRAPSVVVAGGAWSGAFADQLDVRIPVEPQRGQIVHLDCSRDTAGWPIVGAFRHHYLVPWPDGRVAAGATRETGSGFAPHATAAGIREVLDEALRVAPGLEDAAIDDVRVGLRPLSADDLPVLGPVPTVEGVYLATGHGPTGLQLGPYSGKLVADAIRGREPETDISAFRVERFA